MVRKLGSTIFLAILEKLDKYRSSSVMFQTLARMANSSGQEAVAPLIAPNLAPLVDAQGHLTSDSRAVLLASTNIVKDGVELTREQFNDEVNKLEGSTEGVTDFDEMQKLRRMITAYKNDVSYQYVSPIDAAMAFSDNLGGIDLNSANLNLQIKRDGKGVALPLDQQDLALLGNIEGLDPVILSIKPASQALLF